MKENSTENEAANRWTTILLIIYLAVLTWILLFKLGVQFSYMSRRRVNLIPFREPVLFTAENILNVLVFVPVGIYAGILFQRWNARKQFLFIFCLSLLVEGLQYVLSIGAFDSTDIITNTTGGIIGLLLFKGIEKLFSNKGKAQKFINIFGAAGTALLILLLVMLKMNLLPIRYQ